MNLYCVQFDGQQNYIEAPDMREAIRLWAEHNVVAREFDGSEEPESCALVHDEPVIRSSSGTPTREAPTRMELATALLKASSRLLSHDHALDVADAVLQLFTGVSQQDTREGGK